MVSDFFRNAQIGREIRAITILRESVDVAGLHDKVGKCRICGLLVRKVMHHTVLIHIFYRTDSRVAVGLVNISACGLEALSIDIVRILLALVA